MVRFAEDDTYGDQDVTYGDQDWAAGAYDDAAYAQPADAYAPADAQATDAASDDAVYDATDYAEEDYGELDVAEPRFPELEAAAASHLQACERGRSTRKRHRAKKTAQAQGATALQARVRGRNERRRGRDFMRTPNAAAAAAPDPRTPGGGLKGAVAVRFAESQLDDAPAAFRARRPPTPLPQLGAMAYDDDDDDDEVEEDAALATPRRDDAPAPEVDHVDVHADPSPTSVIASPPVRRSVGFSADPPKRARNVAADDEPPRRARFAGAAEEPPRKARFATDSPPRKARFAADSPKARFAGDSPKARFAEEPSPPRRARFAADSPPRRARFADAADTPPAAQFPGASPPHAVAADSPLRRARFPGASPPHAADSPPRRASFAAPDSPPPRRRTRFAETTTESPAPSDDDARSRRVHRAGGTPPAHRRRARAREPSPDASELHATRQASLAAAALDARKKRGPRDADDAMAFSPPGAYSPSRRDSDGAVRVQFVAGAAPDDAQPPLEAASPVRKESKSRLGVLEARLAALEAGRGPRRRKKAASRRRHEEEVHVDEGHAEEKADDEDASDGFLLAFLVAGGVDAPRAVRAAARLRLRGSYASSQAFATIPAATLQQAGLRAHEIRATLRAARLARQALRAAPQRRAKVKMSQSTGDADASFADALKPRRAPRVDPNSWAHRRRALIRSAERRRRLRQTE